MKAISLWQPWASLWLSQRKIHETRHWPTSHRGKLLVHATKRFEKNIDGELREILDDEFGAHWAMDLPTGALIGVVDLIDCVKSETVFAPGPGVVINDDYFCGDFSRGRWAWRRGEFTRFARPVPFRGLQGLFNVEPAGAPALAAQLAEAGWAK